MRFNFKKLIEIVSDDEKYLKHTLYSHCEEELDNIQFFAIPKLSFTASRLNYASPESLSHYSRVKLLGGIPKHLCEDQKSTLRKMITKIILRINDEVSEQVVRNGYKTVYNETSTILYDIKSQEIVKKISHNDQLLCVKTHCYYNNKDRLIKTSPHEKPREVIKTSKLKRCFTASGLEYLNQHINNSNQYIPKDNQYIDYIKGGFSDETVVDL